VFDYKSSVITIIILLICWRFFRKSRETFF